MTHDLKPYPAYKDSGVPWLGKVPEHWEVLRSQYVFREKDRRSATGQETHLSMSQKYGLIRSDQIETHRLMSESYVGAKICERGDLVLNRLKAHLGVFALAPEQGLVSPDYTVLRPTRNIISSYFEYVYRTPTCRVELRQRAKGIVEGFWRLYTDDFYQIPVPVPPLIEQSIIVRYLDNLDRRIRHYIRAKKKLIKLLEEQKQAIIHQAVTRGLDPDVKLKPSGVKWLGDVPEHWEIKPLKYWVHINRKTLPETTDEDYTFSYIDIGSVTTGRIVRPLEKIRFGKAPSRARRIISKGDTIISTVRTYLKAILYISEEANLIVSTGFAVLSPKEDVFPEYLGYIIQSDTFIDQVTANSIGVAYPAISESSLGRFKVSLPLSIIEQEQIACFVKKETAFLEKAISSAYQEISLLREYRTRLIADVVTGKLDVREAAANLSDKSDEMEVEDDFEEETTEESLEEIVTEEMVEGEL